MNKTIKTIKDLEQTLGTKLARNIIAVVRDKGGMKKRRVPYSVTFHSVKPQMHLGDYDTLTAYAVDILTGKILGEHYCGSYDTVLNHRVEQLGQGEVIPSGTALVFVTVHGGGNSLSWALDVVSSDIQKQLAGI